MSRAKVSVSKATPQSVASNVTDLLLNAAAQHNSSGLLFPNSETDPEPVFCSYPDLLHQARCIFSGLRARIPSEAKVVILLARPADFIPTFWACMLGGYVPCPLAQIQGDPERWSKHLSHVDSLLERPLFISSASQLSDLPSTVATAELKELRKSAPSDAIHRANSADTALLMLTSGSTGNSKAVELNHTNLLASMAGRAARQQLSGTDTTFNWIAFDHVAALLESHLIATYVGAKQVHVEPRTVLVDPLKFLQLIDRHRISIAFAPNFLLGQINAALADRSHPRRLSIDLCCLRRIVTGGEANVVETGRQFLDQLAPYGLRRNALWPAFGMTETCAASVYSDQFPNIDANHEFAAVGVPIDGVEIRIASEAGGALPENATGELQLRGPIIFRRYYNNEEATRAAFTEDGWFRTGDLGRLEDGRLNLVARSKDSIIVSGVNYFSHELETQLEQLSGVDRSFVAAFPTRPKGADTEQLVVTFATTLPQNDEEGLYRLLVAVRNTTIMLWGFRPAVIIPLPKHAFPKTSLGKIQRSLMRKRFEAGDFAAQSGEIARITKHQAGAHVQLEGPLESAVGRVFAKILRMDLAGLSSTANFFDLGGTSLDILKFTQALERDLGFKGGLPFILANPSVRKLASHISTAGKGSQPKYDPIIPLQMTGKKTPLFCVHPGNGEIFSLVNVAKYFLNDRPFYALRARGFNESEECFKSLKEMLSTYADAIVQRQPQGPYAIAGYSMGCPIAFEVAKELEKRGEKVGFLGCIDGRPRYDIRPLGFNMAAGLALVIDVITFEQFSALNRELRPDMPTDEVCGYVFKLGSARRLAELNLDLEKFSVWSRVAHAMESMLYANESTGKVNTMTVFCGEGYSPRYLPEWSSTMKWRTELKRWDQFVLRPRYIEVPGDHHTLMGPKHVAGFQAVLRAEISLALGDR